MNAENKTAIDFNAKPRLLLVDDEKNVLSSLRRLFRKLDCVITLANSGKEGLEKLEEQTYDLIISDARMPEMSGPEFLAIAAEKYPDTERMMLTGYADMEATVDAINLGRISRYIEKPWDDEKLIELVKGCLSVVELRNHNAYLQELVGKQNEQLKAVNESLEEKVEERTKELKASHGKLQKSYRQTVDLFSSLLDQRQQRAGAENIDIVALVDAMANELGLDGHDRSSLRYATLLRYIGQLGMSDSLLGIPIESMNKEQKKLYGEYPLRGSMLLSSMPPLRKAAETIGQHKEYVNGKGFPKRDFGKHIALPAKILNIVNDYVELITGRLHADQLTPGEAMSYIESRADSFYEVPLVELLKKLVSKEIQESVVEEERLWLNQLRAGMTLSQDFLNDNGALLLAKGSVLDEELIRKLFDLEKMSSEKFFIFVNKEEE